MPRIMVDTSFPFSKQAAKLEELFGNPLAWAYAVQLWCWAMNSGTASGDVYIPSEARLRTIAGGYSGKVRMLPAFVLSGILEPAAGDYYRVKGWDINAKYFKEKDRLKARDVLKNTRGESAGAPAGPPPQNPRGIPSPSPSPSPFIERESGEDQLEVFKRPIIDARALELEKFYLDKRGGGILQRLPPKERAALQELVDTTTDPKAVIENFLGDKREYYEKRKWPLRVLLENIQEHLGHAPSLRRRLPTSQEVQAELEASYQRALREKP